jgi:hypothetical protein
MTRHLIFILTLLFSISAYGQKKITFTNGLKKTKIKIGKTIGVTQKNEQFYYENWKSVCSGCQDTICRQNIWTLDTIRTDYIIVRQLIDNDSAFIFDTLTYQDKKKLRKYSKEWYWVGEIKSSDSILLHNKLVYKYPIAFNRRKIKTDSIQSFSFSRSDDCIGYDLGVPLIAAIAIIGSPIAAFDKGKFDVGVFAVGEAIGLLIVYSMYRDYQNKLVKTYSTDKWKMKIK